MGRCPRFTPALVYTCDGIRVERKYPASFFSHPSFLVHFFHRIAAAAGLAWPVLISYESFERMKVTVQTLIISAEWLHVLTFLCSFWVYMYVLDEGSYFPFCSCNSWMLNLYLQLFLGLLWSFSYPVWILLLVYAGSFTRAFCQKLERCKYHSGYFSAQEKHIPSCTSAVPC